jgi:hypothetical protein
VQTQNEEVGTDTSCTLTTDNADVKTDDIYDDSDSNDNSDLTDPNRTLPNLAYTFDTNIDFISMTLTQEEKFNLAVDLIKRVVATDEFRDRVVNHTYNGVKTYVDNGGYTNEEIYQKLLEGAETLQPAKNNTMDMEVELYYENSTTIGYTNTGTTRIWVNTKYFNTNPIKSVASNLMHEWLHKLGFRHAVNYSISRDYSVPYAVGRILGSIGSTL